MAFSVGRATALEITDVWNEFCENQNERTPQEHMHNALAIRVGPEGNVHMGGAC